MPDLDVRHPELGDISLEKTPDISRKFIQAKETLIDEGHFYFGDASIQ